MSTRKSRERALKKFCRTILAAGRGIALAILPFLFGCAEREGMELTLVCANLVDLHRSDALIGLDLPVVQSRWAEFEPGAAALFDDDMEIPVQVDDADGDGQPDRLLWVADFKPLQKKTFTLRRREDGEPKPAFTKRTQAELAVKKDFKLKDGYYTGGRFVSVQEATVPPGHFVHNAYFKFEGPGWESDRVGYRLYLDERNRCDIFGKKTREMVLHHVGQNDLVSDGNESYQSMMEWGRDMFKVGQSLGIGTPALWHNGAAATVSAADSVRCRVAANGDVYSLVDLFYSGWNVGNVKRDLRVRFSIAAGSRLTTVRLSSSDPEALFCTGLAKHDGTVFFTSPDNGAPSWGYIALYGKQSLAGDDLGIGVLFRNTDLIQKGEDELSYLVVLRPESGALTYCFAAAWQQEVEGIVDVEGFRQYLDATIRELDSPIAVEVRVTE